MSLPISRQAERQDVGVIMLPGQRCRKRLVDAGAAAGRVAVDRDRNADAGTANRDPALGLAAGNGVGKFGAKFGVINAFRSVGAKVSHLMPGLAKPLGELVFQQVSGMVGGKGDAHGDDLGDTVRIRHPCVPATLVDARLTGRAWTCLGNQGIHRPPVSEFGSLTGE
jgi:hypothetical protein